jgi:ribosomal protein S18 acetylase RimI-like enzyme
MIEDIKNLILSHNDVNDGVLINYNIDEFVLKLGKYATILTYYSKSQLKGFIAYYSNDIINRNAYLTMIIIDKGNRGEGLGKLLLKSSISDLIHRGFHNYKLEVLKNNTKALKMYQKYGFVIEEDRGDLWLMNLNIK